RAVHRFAMAAVRSEAFSFTGLDFFSNRSAMMHLRQTGCPHRNRTVMPEHSENYGILTEYDWPCIVPFLGATCSLAREKSTVQSCPAAPQITEERTLCACVARIATWRFDASSPSLHEA